MWFLPSRAAKSLFAMFLLNTVFSCAQIVAALHANSLALLADSGTMLVDSVTYAFNIYAEYVRATTDDDARVRTVDVFASTFSVIALVVVTVYVFVGSLQRLVQADDNDGEETVNGRLVVEFAVGNLVLDVVMCVSFWRGSGRGNEGEEDNDDGDESEERRNLEAPLLTEDGESHTAVRWLPHALRDINMCSAFSHLFADTLRTTTELVGGAIESAVESESLKTDAISSIIVSFFIFFAALVVVYEAYHR